MVPAALATRFLEPLTHPWAAATGALVSVGLAGDPASTLVLRVAWRLLRLLISL